MFLFICSEILLLLKKQRFLTKWAKRWEQMLAALSDNYSILLLENPFKTPFKSLKKAKCWTGFSWAINDKHHTSHIMYAYNRTLESQ